MATDVLEPTTTARRTISSTVREILESAERPRRMTWPAVNDSLAKLARLPENWDGQGAIPPAIDVIELAREFVRSLREDNSTIALGAPSYVRPTPDGCVSFEWTSDGELIFEAEVTATGIEFISSGPGVPTRSFFEPVA